MPISALTRDDFRPKTNAEAARAFGRKVTLTDEQFERLSAAMKSMAFRVAGVHNARVVQRIRDLLEKAIRSGTSMADWQRQVLALLDTKGIPIPSRHRLRLAFRQNTMQAYSDARRKVLDSPEVTGAFPYRMYWTVGNGTPGFRRVRADHAVLHGKIFRWNDAFWNRFTPPWDYNCRCTDIALTAGQVARRKAQIWTYAGGAIRPASRKTGKALKNKKGAKLKPNPGFGGKSSDLTFDLSGLDADLRKLFE